MKKLIVLILLLWGLNLHAQTTADTVAIKTAAINYVEGFFRFDTVKLANALSPELVKRYIDNRTGKLITIGQSELIRYSKSWQNAKDKNPDEPFTATVDIYDIAYGIAIAKVATNKMPQFFDYVQVGKINGEWKIINVLWAFK